MRVDIPRLVIAAPRSGSGKSTVTTGLIAALSSDYVVQGFKVGPDYIDPGYHTAASGRVSHNLDTWMVSPVQVQRTFARAVAGADVALVEGVMGLYDGYDARTERGSTAEVAKLLDAPLVLVIDVGKMARSAGAMALGYRDFDPALNLAGVICNNVASDKHGRWVREAIESIGLPVLGCVPRRASLTIPERHLGLHMALERQEAVQAFLVAAAALVQTHVDLARLWQLAGTAAPWTVEEDGMRQTIPVRTRIAVARDEAFCFYYEDNLDLLRAAGAEIVFFSPLRDASLPAGSAGLYLGGGYPELYATRLAANEGMISAIRAAVDAGMPTYAECGGLMTLTESITDLEGETHPMVAALPGRAQMRQRLAMGYRRVIACRDTLLLPEGGETRGHEFHYSDWEVPVDLPRAYALFPRQGEAVRHEGYARDNLLASYVHLHFGANAEMAPRFVAASVRWQERRQG